MAVVYATVIVVLVFMPVFFLEGLAGSFFRPLALSYVLAVGASLGVALVVTPALSPCEDRAAAWHAAERARLAAAGRLPGFAGGQVAAVAKLNGLSLVTGNLRHYRDFAGLSTVNWRRRLAASPLVLSEGFSDGSRLEGVRFVNPFRARFRIDALLTRRP